MTIKEYLSNRNNYGGTRSASAIKYIVIHFTGNDGDTAWGNCNYFHNNDLRPNPASAHYFVDNTSVYRSVPENYNAYSVGAKTYRHPYCRNSNSISVELCDCKKNGVYDFTQATIKNAIELVQYLMKKYNVPMENVIRHYDVTGKECPLPFVKSNALWQDFKNMLKADIHKYQVNQRILVNIPIAVAYDDGSEHVLVDSNGYQFWIHRSVIKNSSVYGLGDICYCQGDGLYIVQIFDNQFWCREQYLSDKF